MSLRSPLSVLISAAAAGITAQYCDLPSAPQWASTPDGPLAQPAHNWTSLKDFSHVPYEGQHLVYGSNVNNGSYGSMAFGLFTDWSDMVSVGWRVHAASHALTLSLFRRQPIKLA
jgi:hypothetical protein